MDIHGGSGEYGHPLENMDIHGERENMDIHGERENMDIHGEGRIWTSMEKGRENMDIHE